MVMWHTIQIFIISILIINGIQIGAMNTSTTSHNRSLVQVLPVDVITKIIACCIPNAKNVLIKVSKKFNLLASRNNHTMLYEHPLYLSTIDSKYYLLVGCIQGDVQLVSNLLRNNCEYTSSNILRVSPVYLAEQRKHTYIASLFAMSDTQKKAYIMPPEIALAVYCNDIQWVNKCVYQGVDINQPIELNGMTPLMVSVGLRSTVMMRVLLEKEQVDINAQNKKGRTSLMLATRYANIDALKLLLEQPKIAINTQNIEGRTALHSAVARKLTTISKCLLTHSDLAINTSDNYGCTALLIAVNNGCVDIVRCLLAFPDIDVNAKNRNGLAALHIAANKKFDTIMQLLLAHATIQVNIMNDAQFVPLHIAACKGFVSMARLLLKHPDIRTDIKNDKGFTPLDFAIKYGHDEITDLLK
jgi:ankyrin repeat protein